LETQVESRFLDSVARNIQMCSWVCVWNVVIFMGENLDWRI